MSTALCEPPKPVAAPLRARVEPVPIAAGGYDRWKRLWDVLLAAALLALAWPLMLAATLAIRREDHGPALFRQRRAGRGGRPFWMYKFRTMVPGAQGLREIMPGGYELLGGPVFKLRADPRLTRIGRLLRRTSIDELPQLLNVLKGDMSLVGPRPLPLDEADTSDATAAVRLQVRPGLTCLWQIAGRCEVPYDRWMELDRLYVETRCFLLDLAILVKTIPAVLSCRGAF